MTSSLSIAILAGGLATRLGAITADTPKSLVDVHGEPFITHQLRLLADHGVRDAVICAGHLGTKIQQAIGAEHVGVRVRYSFEEAGKLLGTAGALKRALPILPERFLVLYGDSYLRIDYQAAWQSFLASDKAALMTVFANDEGSDRSNAIFDGARIVAYDKVHQAPEMKHIDYGLGAFDRAAFSSVPDDRPYDLAVLYQELLAAGQLAAFEASQRYYEIGSVHGLDELRAYLRTGTHGAPS